MLFGVVKNQKHFLLKPNRAADDDALHLDDVAGLRQLGTEPDHLHHLQRRVQAGSR